MSREADIIGEPYNEAVWNMLLPTALGTAVVSTLNRFHKRRPTIRPFQPQNLEIFQPERSILLRKFPNTKVVQIAQFRDWHDEMDFPLFYLLDARFEALTTDLKKHNAFKSQLRKSFQSGYSLAKVIEEEIPNNLSIAKAVYENLFSCIFYEAALMGLGEVDKLAMVKPLTEAFYLGNPCLGTNSNQKERVFLAA